MTKVKYQREFEFNVSKKILFPYFSTASGLARWFAQDVIIDNESKNFTFIWEGDKTTCKMAINRSIQYVKFQVVDSGDDDPNYFEFKLELNELTQSVYVKITDYSDMDEDEADELWSNLIHDLKEIVGG